MKKEILDKFIGKEVTIKLFNKKYYNGFLEVDEYNPKRYLLKRHYTDSDISMCASHIKAIKVIEDKEKK